MASFIYFYTFLLLTNIGKSFCDADHVLTSETSFSIFTPWTDPNAVDTVLLEWPKDRKRATSNENQLNGEDQIMIRIRIGPSNNVGPVEKYLVINDIYDPKRQTKDKALIPYLVEVIRGEPVISYSLDYKKDVKFDDYRARSMHNSKKSSQSASSNRNSDLGGKDYKPAIDRLNAVMKKLTEIFENDNQKADVDAIVYEKGSENDKSRARIDNEELTEVGPKKSKNFVELENDIIENVFRDSNTDRLNENEKPSDNRLENSCLKRHIFENRKNQELFDKHYGKSSKFQKRMSLNAHSEMLAVPMPSDQAFDSLRNQHLLDQRQALAFNGQQRGIRANIQQKHLDLDDDSILQSMEDATSVSSNKRIRRQHHNRIEKSHKQMSHDDEQKQSTRNVNAPILENIDEKGLTLTMSRFKEYQSENAQIGHDVLRLIRAALAEKKSNNLKTKPVREINTHEERKNERLSRANPFYGSPPVSRNFRAKRSAFESGAHRFYKNDDDSTDNDDQCDRSKMFVDHDFDLQSCDTCGGKSKKPQKPPPALNARMTYKRRDLLAKKPVRRQDTPKTEICRCRTHQSPCICCSGKLSRSQSDPVWFSQFSLNSPTAFVTSRIRIFRKRRGIWWEVAPPTDLNSIRGVYSDGNFSFSFSSPIELFQLEKALRLQDQQLLLPSANGPESNDQLLNDDIIARESIEAKILNSKQLNSNPNLLMTVNKKAAVHKKSPPEIRPLRDFGFFPTTMNAIEKCPYNDKRLCLNMLTDEAPASTFKIQMPFQDNVLVNKNTIRVQISNIITDATTKDAMQISVLVINKGVKSILVTLNINNCPTVADSSLTEAKTCVQKLLLPNIADTATFLLPLIQPANAKHKKFECQVEVLTKVADGPIDKVPRRTQNDDIKVVSKRKFLVEPDKRCLCIWHCACHCIPKLVPHSDYNMCQKMSASELRQAGFPKDTSGQSGFAEGKDSQSTGSAIYKFIRYAAYLLLLMLLLGLIKAILGLFSTPIDRWLFDYVYVNPNYACSTRMRRFFGNVFIFVILPFRFLCTCFTPSPEDLLVASSEWQCCQAQDPMCEDEFDDSGFLKNRKSASKSSSKSKGRLVSGIEAKQQELSKRLSRLSLAFQQEISDEEYSPKKAPKSAIEIVRTLSERRDERRKSRQNLPSTSASAAREKLASEFVQTLLDAKRVYRTLKEPIGNVSKVPHGVKYCIQGYFIATLDSAFEFVSFQPLVQYRGIAAQTFLTKELHPPIFLVSGAFNRRYSNEVAVLKSGDISVQPPEGVPCINVRVVDDASDAETTSSATSNQRVASRHEQRSSSKRYQR